MKKKNIILGLLLSVGACASINISTVKAISVDDRLVVSNGEKVPFSSIKSGMCNIDVGEVVFSNPIKVEDKNIEYYCTFKSNDIAAEEAMIKYKKGFDYIIKNYGLADRITDDNWKEFQKAVIDALNDNEVDADIRLYLRKIDGFFDIYENKDINLEINNLAKQISVYPGVRKSYRDDSTELKNRLDEIIPNYSDNFETIEQVFDTKRRVGASLDVPKAVEYAKKYAEAVNTIFVYYSGRDCTNFVSQILVNAGVKTVEYTSKYKGWWYRFGMVPEHSNSWSVADTFAKYMGVTVSTKSIYKWSKDLRKGDIIGYDKNSDGSWDHMAFVTDHNGSLHDYSWNTDNYSGYVQYYDVQIAQHSKNYLKWISDSGNGWEELVQSEATFGRIRG